MAITAFLLQTAVLTLSLIALQAATALQQRHLGGEVTALPHLDITTARKEGDVVAAAVGAGPHQPERSCHRANAVVTFRCKRFWRPRRLGVAGG